MFPPAALNHIALNHICRGAGDADEPAVASGRLLDAAHAKSLRTELEGRRT